MIDLSLSSIRVHPRPSAVKSPPAHPLGLYVHIPFCVRKCYYCDFASGPAPAQIREQYVDALVEEIRQSAWRGAEARTVFFGGGTPSELNSDQLRRITQALREAFRFVPADPEETASHSLPLSHSPTLPFRTPHSALRTPEWTIECNPGTVTVQSLAAMREMGFNRLSLGVQSFHDHHLKALGRIHTAGEVAEAVSAARHAGFRRLNLDLIFCLPGQTLAEWRQDVERALELAPEHLSLYNLTIEEETEFGRRHRLGQLALPDDDLSADMYEWVIDRMAAAGFVLYEVSNFARPGEECLHNRIYWRQEPSLGFGLSAASYVDGCRWASTRSMQRYLATSGRESGPERQYEERLPPLAACGETVMLGLRTAEGVDLSRVAARYGIDPEPVYGHTVERLVADGLLLRCTERLKLTRRGIMLADAVCAEFLQGDLE
jgi:oxygen-independent coproporphyrinogen-3 oxidase